MDKIVLIPFYCSTSATPTNTSSASTDKIFNNTDLWIYPENIKKSLKIEDNVKLTYNGLEKNVC